MGACTVRERSADIELHNRACSINKYRTNNGILRVKFNQKGRGKGDKSEMKLL